MKNFIRWDGSPLTVKDLQKIAPDIIAGYYEYDTVLYVKTPGNPMTPVPIGAIVSRSNDGYALIRESDGPAGNNPDEGTPG